jgi:hypothetical protein
MRSRSEAAAPRNAREEPDRGEVVRSGASRPIREIFGAGLFKTTLLDPAAVPRYVTCTRPSLDWIMAG